MFLQVTENIEEEFYYDYDPEYHADPMYDDKDFSKDMKECKKLEKIGSSPPVIRTYIERCSRWCCQGPDLPPVFEDAHSSFGRYVSEELRSIKDFYERQMCKMKVNTVLFEACVGKYDGVPNEEAKTEDIVFAVPQLSNQIDDQLASFGRYIANELKGIKNLNARQIAKLKISTILYEGTVAKTAHQQQQQHIDEIAAQASSSSQIEM